MSPRTARVQDRALRGSVDLLLLDEPTGPQALIALLQKVQTELGYVPEEAIRAISERTGVAASEVFGTLTFYTQFRLRPRGRRVVRVCRGTACHVRGGEAVRHKLERILGIRPGETTSDGEYTLETVACVGACARAPVVVMDDLVYGQMTPPKVDEMLAPRSGEQND